MTPLHVAVKQGMVDFLTTALSAKSSNLDNIDAEDNEGNNVFHYAAQSDKDAMIKVNAF